MNIRFLNMFCLSILLLTACAVPAAAPQKPTMTQQDTQTTSISVPSSTFTPAPTLTSRPKNTPMPVLTDTPTPTISPQPTQTATINIFNLSTRTPQPPAKCPAKYDELKPTPVYFGYRHILLSKNHKIPDDFMDVRRNFIQDLPNFLSKYGPAPIIHEFWTNYRDLTNDGIPELILNIGYVQIFGCQDGMYVELYDGIEGVMSNPDIIDIQDANRDGVPEILLLTGYASQGGHSYEILEWDGQTIQNIIGIADSTKPDFHAVMAEATGKAWFEDADRDGFKELVVDTGLPVWQIYRDYLPWRSIHKIFHWNGQYYSFKSEDFATPEYRFQAVQDGDRKSLTGEYDKALALYQNAIFSDKLGWWSAERQHFYQAVWDSQNSNQPTPISPQPDPLEYPYLEAYARFRITLLHIVQNHLSDAQTVYDTLQQKFPKGQPGFIYAEMAKAFWETYQSTHNIQQACSQAIDYANQNPAVLQTYIGDRKGESFHGSQSLYYKPEDICPFK
jgi:hypothetical protein